MGKQWPRVSEKLGLTFRNGHHSYVYIVYIVLLCGRDTHEGKVILGLLVPHNGSRSMGPEVEVAMDLALQKVNTSPELVNIRKANLTFEYITANTLCDIGTGLFELVQMRNSVDGFIGPACDSLCEPAGLLAGKWNVPMISYSCTSTALNNRALYPTFARTTALYVKMENTIVDIVQHFHWTRVVIVEGPEEIWRETAGRYQETLEQNGVRTEMLSIPSMDAHYVLEKHLQHAASEAYIFILCAYGLDILYVMCAAETAHLLNGDYAFISIDFSYMTNSSPTNRPCNMGKNLNGLLDITIQLDEDYEEYKNFVRTIVSTVGGQHGTEIAIHSGMMYDSVYLYARGVDTVLEKGGDIQNGTALINQLINGEFQGITGSLKLNVNGTRQTNFTVHNMFLGAYTSVAHSNGSLGGLHLVDDAVIYWPDGSTNAPLGRPACGWDGQFCSEANIYMPVFVAIGLVLLLIVSFSSGMAFYFYRKKKLQDLMESTSWKVPFDELEFKTFRRRGGSSMSCNKITSHSRSYSPSTDTVNKSFRTASFDSNISFGGQLFTKIAHYKGRALAVKIIRKPYVAITQALIKEINEIRQLNHRNVNPLVGVCVDPMKTSVLSVYCSKGSLQDVLENDDIKLDQIFKVSFATDIAKGMNYLHNSVVKSHGRLKSLNVFIDQQWSCKIGDISMPVLREGERPLSAGDIRENYQLLWTAPELLRYPLSNSRGTQKGDVYSYGIVLQEIMLRTGPFGYTEMDPEDILNKVKEKQTPPFRPRVPVVEGVVILDDVMRMCWEEVPVFRPNFSTILLSLKKLSNGKTTNLVDQMIHMMSRYADHLEELVKERTEQLEIEQRRTEELLCRMLPRSIANDLKVGKTVQPETYDSVTVYFSDIVGFTALSSRSSPMEIVNFLNDLYICFDRILENYDVYKVETIGDAYMVVSGLPKRNDNKHSGEIATMALDLLSSVTTFKIRHEPKTQLQVRIGIHSGPVCAGVVGLKMPRYCLFGDTVNYASRMESAGLALRIHVSPECKLLLEELDGFYFECRGYVTMKGKGSIQTYFLLGRQGFSKKLPDLKLAAPIKDHEFK